MSSSCWATIWKPGSESKRRNPSMTMGCGDSRQTFGLAFAHTFAIVSQAHAIDLRRPGRRGCDFIPDTGGEAWAIARNSDVRSKNLAVKNPVIPSEQKALLV